MIEDLIPEPVVAVETRDLSGAVELFEDELVALGAAAPRRLREFAAGRSCARGALERLGLACAPIRRGPDREPLWPAGVVGSITHCPGYCAAVAAESSAIAALGIDAEVDEGLPPGVLPRIALPEEASWIADRHGDGRCWDRLLFSAKESVFKAWFPLTHRWLGFEQARVTFDAEAATFEAALRVAGPPLGGRRVRCFEGRFLVRDGLAVTAIAVASPGASGR